jgi:hypothetical protein
MEFFISSLETRLYPFIINFTQPRTWRLLSPRMWRRVAQRSHTIISVGRFASIFSLEEKICSRITGSGTEKENKRYDCE